MDAGGILDLLGGLSRDEPVDTGRAGSVNLIGRRVGLVAAEDVDAVHLGAAERYDLPFDALYLRS